jgi:hypothetical protein
MKNLTFTVGSLVAIRTPYLPNISLKSEILDLNDSDCRQNRLSLLHKSCCHSALHT